VIDLLQGGQGVFGIAVGKVVREVEGSLAELPGERADDVVVPAPAPPAGTDELSRRRSRRDTA
ncbi:MAG TPA: transcriptional regulator, partial [Mycobacteriales bacterium]|nr:transcriptional regulator [Mycobacteriales bacterium]